MTATEAGILSKICTSSGGTLAHHCVCWPTGNTGYSPLHYAARGGHGAAVDLLLRQGEGC